MDAYFFTGDMDRVMVRQIRQETPPSLKQQDALLPELALDSDGVRVYPGWPGWLDYECVANEDSRLELAFADVISSVEQAFGAATLVSERAAIKLTPHLVGQAQFYPARLRNAPQPYFLLWIAQVIDALDAERSVTERVEYQKQGEHVPLRLVRPQFKPDKIRDALLFRLPAANLVRSTLEDFATPAFINLVRKLKITGFHFYRSYADRPIVPVLWPGRASAARRGDGR